MTILANSYDLVIVGSGPAAWSVLASYLKASKAKAPKVAIMESGPLRYRGEDDNDIGAPNQTGQPFRLTPTTASALGGTSNLWHGIVGPLDPIDFEPRPHITSALWPIAYKELEPWYAWVADTLGWDAHLFHPRHRPQKIADMVRKAQKGNGLLEPKIFLQPHPIFRSGPAIEVLVQAHKNVTLLTEHHVLEVSTKWIDGETKGTVEGVIAGRPDGSTVFVPARQVVLCAGALQSPRILLNSAPEWHKRNAKSAFHLGRYLMDHPMGVLFQVDYGKVGTRKLFLGYRYGQKHNIRAPLRLSEAAQRTHGLPNTAFYLRPSFSLGEDDVTEETKLALLTLTSGLRRGRFPIKEALRVARRPGLVLQILQYKFGISLRHRYAQAYFITEQRPNPESRVRLTDQVDRWGYCKTDVHWKIESADFEALQRMYELIASHFTTPFPPNFDKWAGQISSAAHHLGTCRMAANPADGVVNSSGEVFGLRGLFVADGSTFVTSGNANSTFTVMALGARVGNKLAETL